MSTFFSTVPVELARAKREGCGTEPVRSLILVVNDEPLISETLAAILTGSGFAAVTASTGAGALEIAELTPPELLIADDTMSDMSGADLALEVTRRVPDCEVILFATLLAEGGEHKCALPGGRSMASLRKPVHPAHLLSLVMERLGAKSELATTNQ